jgi:response regulator RpfG family c-di-GMP phosphodiesterase
MLLPHSCSALIFGATRLSRYRGERRYRVQALIMILVVDDETLIQDMVHQALYGGGFGIKIAASGEAAAKLLEGNENNYRALITDVTRGVGPC